MTLGAREGRSGDIDLLRRRGDREGLREYARLLGGVLTGDLHKKHEALYVKPHNEVISILLLLKRTSPIPQELKNEY